MLHTWQSWRPPWQIVPWHFWKLTVSKLCGPRCPAGWCLGDGVCWIWHMHPCLGCLQIWLPRPWPSKFSIIYIFSHWPLAHLYYDKSGRPSRVFILWRRDIFFIWRLPGIPSFCDFSLKITVVGTPSPTTVKKHQPSYLLWGPKDCPCFAQRASIILPPF